MTLHCDLHENCVFLNIHSYRLKSHTEQETSRSDVIMSVSVPQGHDTTSAGICWTLFLLGLHTDVQVSIECIRSVFCNVLADT